ncbi:FmdB family zinc ribbon protein [uncultured Cellulomonas sp.]|uniref:FmdB family zinc ribbon protein n=1 Tax=uncultured Cellulomonas sp. TaxID=189682 RepID=UPI002602EB7C|nr:FmdB family zinc ribbon protein [uncultured Cellulomonas sp.]
MPTYPYACTACGHAFEVHQSFSDPSLTECPECSGRLRKVFSSVGVVFKGSGFYRTDSRSGSSSTVKSGGSDSGSGTSGAGGSGSTGTDTKPAASSGSNDSSSTSPSTAKPSTPAAASS